MKTINQYDFVDAFRNWHSGTYSNNFSYDGLHALYDYLEQLEEDTGEEMGLDVVAICCDFNEEHWETVAEYYDIDLTDCADADSRYEAVKDYIEYNSGLVAELDNGNLIYWSF